MKYRVMVDDNFHYMDESERYCAGEFDSAEEAVEFARQMVDKNLDHLVSESVQKGGSTADDFYNHYTSFGEDPFVSSDDMSVKFSAWTYAKERCEEIWEELNTENETEVENPYDGPEFFPFRSRERFIKYELLGFVHKLNADPSRSPNELTNLAILKLALDRLPKTTPAVHIGLGIVLRDGGNTDYCDISISDSRFSLSSGGYVSSPAFGGDSFSSTLFECESHGFRDGSTDPWDIGAWHAQAQDLIDTGAVLSFENYSDENEIEWEYGSNKDPWDELDERIRRWEEAGGDLE